MIQHLNVFFYDIYPYLCGTVFILGGQLRYDYGQYTWHAASNQTLDKHGVMIRSNLFHIGILGIFFGHLFGTLTPRWMYVWFLPMVMKQQMTIIPGGICGVLALVGGAGLLVRRLANLCIRMTSSGTGILALAILSIQCILGLTAIPFSAQRPDGSEIMKLADWARNTTTSQGGASTYLDGVVFIFRVYLVLGITIFLLSPFIRLVHVWSTPSEYLTCRYQIVRSRHQFSRGPDSPSLSGHLQVMAVLQSQGSINETAGLPR